MGIKVQVRVRLKDGAMVAAVERLGSTMTLRAARAAQEEARWNIAKHGRNRTGAMSQGIKIEKIGAMRYRVIATEPYSIFQEKGVRPFSAKPGKFLVFMPKGGTSLVFAKRVKGFKGIHFMRDAMRSLRKEDFTG